jgi:hypothetical protein|tara:strand:- start:162 stop:266 length:105 start_codon:yes stop_codon:yes gene_type:complete
MKNPTLIAKISLIALGVLVLIMVAGGIVIPNLVG